MCVCVCVCVMCMCVQTYTITENKVAWQWFTKLHNLTTMNELADNVQSPILTYSFSTNQLKFTFLYKSD